MRVVGYLLLQAGALAVVLGFLLPFPMTQSFGFRYDCGSAASNIVERNAPPPPTPAVDQSTLLECAAQARLRALVGIAIGSVLAGAGVIVLVLRRRLNDRRLATSERERSTS
jgi:hypothetical protein